VEIPEHFKTVQLDAWVVMPNHVHGIIIIQELENLCRGGVTPPLQTPQPPPPYAKPMTLGTMVAYFKYQSTKQMNAVTGNIGQKIWQRNYYDHIIRTETALNNIRRYILGNPMMWRSDMEHPDNGQNPDA
jgi:REP element-mobilizing transposase RayT